MNVRQAIERLLEATATATALKVRVDRLRADLADEAERRYTEEGAAPAWNVRGLGKVRLDGTDVPRKAVVKDPEAYGSWIAEHTPEVATAVVELEPEHLERALASFEFLGIPIKGARVDVDPAFTARLLDGLELTITEHLAEDRPEKVERVSALRVDPVTGLVDEVPGIGALPPAAHKLVVNLDPARKAQAVHDAEAELDAEDGEQRAADELDDLRREAGIEVLAEQHRDPYVGAGADGARRSAQIDREEVDTLPTGPHQPGWSEATEERRTALLASAERWEAQAGQLDPPPGTPAPEVAAEVEAAVARMGGLEAVRAAAPPLSAGESVVALRFEVDALTPKDLDADQAEERRRAVEEAEEHQLEAEPITLAVHDAVMTPAADEPGGTPAAADAARRTLEQTIRTPAVLESAKVDQLRHLAELAGIRIPKARLGKAALAQLITDRLAATEAPA